MFIMQQNIKITNVIYLPLLHDEYADNVINVTHIMFPKNYVHFDHKMYQRPDLM